MRKRFANGLLAGSAGLLVLCTIAGCDREEIRAYTAPKDAPPGLGRASAPPSAAERVDWTLPEGWRQLPGSGMRFATLLVEPGDNSLELKVTPLAPAAGDALANVNRWSEQIGLERIDAKQLPSVMREIQIAGRDAQLVNLVGVAGDAQPAQQILAAILIGDGSAWFFVIQGQADRVKEQEADFEQFLGTVRLISAEEAQSLAGDLPPGHPEVPGDAPPASQPSAGEQLTWETPAGWQEQQSQSSQFRLASFTVTEGERLAEVVITRFPGDVGGVLANINRWRDQIGLAPIDDLSQQTIERLEVDGHPAGLIDLTAAEQETASGAGEATTKRMLVVLLARPDMTWFIKMTGSSQLLEAQRETFGSFIRSMKLTGDDK
jgi:hypothetical protein